MRFSCAIAEPAIMKKKSENYTVVHTLVVVTVLVPTITMRTKTAPTRGNSFAAA